MAFKIGVVADDLTGGCDTGAQFSRRGLKVIVLFSPLEAEGALDEADVVVIDTDSRALPAEAAFTRVREACMRLKAGGIGCLYKKLDSTLRGNVGAELEVVMDVLGVSRAAVAPAFPPQGRTFQDGQLLIWGAIPQAPALQKTHLPTLLRAQMKRQVGHLDLQAVRGGSAVFTMEEAWGRGEEVLAVDAATQEDLKAIAATFSPPSLDRVPAGSAGLAMELAEAWGPRKAAKTPPRLHVKRATVIAGSPNPVTTSQVEAFRRMPGGKVLSLHLSRLLEDEAAETNRVAQGAASIIRSGADLVVWPEGLAPASVETAHDVASRITRALGKVARAAVEADPGICLILTGGETARGACLALEAYGIELVREVLPGIPAGRLRGGPFEGLLLVTKAGGFGQEDVFVHLIRLLKEGIERGRGVL